MSPKFKEGLGAAAFFDGAAFATTSGAGGAFFGGAAFATALGAGGAFFGGATFFAAAGLGFVGFKIESEGGAFGVGGVSFGGTLSCFCLSSHSRALARTISAASSAIFRWPAARLASASAAAVDF